MNDRFYRSRSDRMLAGVAGGVAERFDLDPSVVRVLWAILIVLSGGIFLLIYIVMAIVVPEEPLGAPGTGWSGSGSWSTSWPTGWPTPANSSSDPAGPAPGMQTDLAPTDPVPPGAAAVDVRGQASAAGDPSAAGFAAPAAPGSSAAGFAAPPPTAPGPAAPPAGDWFPPAGGWSADSARSARHAARDARRVARRAARGDRAGSGGIVGGLFLIGLGAYFLIRTFAPQVAIDRYWPAGLIVLGVVLVALSIRRTAGPGAP